MIVFADFSALVKLYADEQDHQLVRELAGLVVSALARVEAPAAIWRKHRMGELDPADAAVLVAAFEPDYHGSADDQPRFAVVAANASVLETDRCRTTCTTVDPWLEEQIGLSPCRLSWPLRWIAPQPKRGHR